MCQPNCSSARCSIQSPAHSPSIFDSLRFCNALICFLLLTILLAHFTPLVCAKDLYEVLGVSRDADVAAIKRAYRKLAMKYHPDKNKGDKEAEKMYVELNNAHEVLSDENKRHRYDMFGEDGLKGGGGGGGDDDDDGGFGSFGDMFGGFGGRRRRRQENRVPDVVIPLSVSLEMLYNGGVLEAVHKRRTICSTWSDCEKKCSRCGGKGFVIQTRRIGPGFVQQIQTGCPACGGRGKTSTGDCSSCPKGQYEVEEKNLLIDIEKGMSDGEEVVFEGQTDEVPDHINGNMRFQVVSQPHSRFVRAGYDLRYTLRVTLSEALVGVNRQVRQLDGRLVPIRTDKVIKPGEEMVIEGEGMPVRGSDDSPGKLVVEFWVDFPSHLTEEEKRKAIELHGEIPSLEVTGDGTNDSCMQGTCRKNDL